MGLFEDTPSVLATMDGTPFVCLVCQGGLFEHRQLKMNTGAAEFFGFAWADRSADCMICTACGYVHWFDGNTAMETWDPEGGYPN